MKLSSLICIIIMTMVLLIGCKYETAEINNKEAALEDYSYGDKSNLDEVISKYIITRANAFHPPTEKQFEVHKIYGKEESGNNTKLYLFSIFDGYTTKDGYFKAEAHSSRYVVMQLEKKDGKYEVIDYEDSLVEEDVKWMFPKEYAEKAINDDVKDLNAILRSKVELWLKSQGRAEKLEGSNL